MFTLPIPVLLTTTIIANWLNSLLSGYFPKKVTSGDHALWFFNLLRNISCALAIIAILICSGSLHIWSLFSVGLGVLMGMANVWGMAANIKAFTIGPFSYTTVIISLSSIIPALSGLFFGETISPVQWCGVLLMVICLILSPDHKTETTAGQKASIKWLVFSLIAAVSNGIIGVVQKLHQNSVHQEEMGALLISCFAISTVLSALMLAQKMHNHTHYTEKSVNRKMLWVIPILTGCVFAFPHTINLFLSGKLDAVILFPLINLCPMLLSMVSGILLFREKLSARRWIGVVIGILATVLVSGIF